MEKADAAFIAQLDREYAACLRQVFDANQDLNERLRRVKVEAIFDIEDDLLEITVGEQQEAASLRLYEDLWLRVDFTSHVIVGVELENAQKHWHDDSKAGGFAGGILHAAGVSHVVARLPQQSGTPTDPFKAMGDLVSA